MPTEPERFAQILKVYSENFTPAFHQRSQEAIRCYGAHAYLACCTMCGAAAESILLTTLIARLHDEDSIMKKYKSQNGRSKIENLLLGQASKQLKEEFGIYNTLMKYWRDEASHGAISKISENEAYTSLALLMRFAMFVSDKWVELTISNVTDR